MTKTGTITLVTGTNVQAVQKRRIEGITLRQAKKMLVTREWMLAQAELPEMTEDQAFEWGCDAFDVENELIAAGFGKLLGL